jgi:hypothetical protein
MNKTSQFIAAVGLALTLFSSSSFAAPGAHGPNGEHLDAPGSSVTNSVAPRIETKSEAFELVGQLQGGELSILINRFESNEPLLGANVEVESGNHKASAKFHSDHGDYAVADEAFLKVLAKPGQHPLVVTVVAGKEADLLEGTLNVPEQAHDHDHDGFDWRVWAAAGLAGLLALAAAWRLWRRRHLRRVLSNSGGVA